MTPAEADRLPGTGQLWSLCPVPDVFDDFRERVSGIARQRARALIREVRRRPDALVTKRYEDSHTGEPFDETTTCVSSPRSTSRTRASTVSHVSAR